MANHHRNTRSAGGLGRSCSWDSESKGYTGQQKIDYEPQRVQVRNDRRDDPDQIDHDSGLGSHRLEDLQRVRLRFFHGNPPERHLARYQISARLFQLITHAVLRESDLA